jgi:hypothetical protein
METNDKQQHIEKFFEAFKSLPNAYTIEKVNQLIHNPNAKATQRVHPFSKHLKITIMTSVIIIGAIAFLFKNSPEAQKFIRVDKTQVLTTEIQNDRVKPNKNLITNKTTINSPFKTDEVPKTKEKTLVANLAVVQADNASEKSIISVNSFTNNTPERHWPADTVLDGKSLFVTLTDEELLKLGVRKMHDTVIYCNDGLYGNTVLNTYGFELEKYSKKIDTTHYTFHYYSSVDIDYKYHNYQTDWNYNKFDTLLPLIMKDINHPSGKDIWWFTTNHELFVALPDRYKRFENIYAELKKLKKEEPNKIFVNYFNLKERKKIFQNINYIQLSDNELINMGFEIIFDTLTVEKLILTQSKKLEAIMNGPIDTVNLKKYKKNTLVQRKMFRLKNDEYLVFCNNYYYYLDSQYKSGFVHPIFGHIDSAKTINLTPRTVTDTLGRFFGGNGILNNNINFSTLIPVKIDFAKYINTGIPFSQVYIFWYEPDSAFISRLPKSIARVLKPEYDAIVKSGGTSSQSCTYFEVCKSTLTLNRLDVYPNPARQMITIDFNAPEDLTGQISLIDIKGSEVKVLQPTTRFVKGENNIQSDVSSINPGIYLIYINTNKGFRTQRIIVTK